jgi:cell volume regulation protein A
MDSVAQTLEIVAAILLLGALGEWVFSRTGIPDAVWLVCAGILAGPVFGLVSPALLQPAVPLFSAIALTVILSASASRLRLEDVAGAAPRGMLLGVIGFVFSVAAVCSWLWLVTVMGFVTRTPFLTWLIAGAIVGGTTSMVVMPTTGPGRVDSRTASTLEVESASTDALSIVLAMVLLDVVVDGGVTLSRPFVALARELGVGVGVGLMAAAALLLAVPTLERNPHVYTVFLAAMLVVYGVTSQLDGNGAMAVLAAGLLVGNASSIMPRLIRRGAHARAFVLDHSTRVVQDQLSFLIKSFVFVLIGLMFPTSLRLILLGAIPVLLLLAARIVAVRVATFGLGLTKRQYWILAIAIPRGLAAGVLSAIPVRHGIAGPDFIPAIFSLIVTSILVFSAGVALVGRLLDERAT